MPAYKHPIMWGRFKIPKTVWLLPSLALLACMGVGTTPSLVDCQINERFTDGDLAPKGVSISNTGDTTAYIRAAIVATWQNEKGDVWAIAPIGGVDYTPTPKAPEGWIKGADGYYDYADVALAKDAPPTAMLIKECKPILSGPQSFALHVEILASAPEEAWGMVVGEGVITSAENGGA